MSRSYTNKFNRATTNRIMINGLRVPLGGLYGTFQGYSDPVQWVVKEYPQKPMQTICIYIYDALRKKWRLPVNPLYKLYDHVHEIITNMSLWGTKTIPFMGNSQEIRESYQFGNPTGKQSKITSLKRANTLHYQRGEQGKNTDYTKRYGDIFSNGEWCSEVTKTISDNKGIVGKCSEHPLEKRMQRHNSSEIGAFL